MEGKTAERRAATSSEGPTKSIPKPGAFEKWAVENAQTANMDNIKNGESSSQALTAHFQITARATGGRKESTEFVQPYVKQLLGRLTEWSMGAAQAPRLAADSAEQNSPPKKQVCPVVINSLQNQQGKITHTLESKWKKWISALVWETAKASDEARLWGFTRFAWLTQGFRKV